MVTSPSTLMIANNVISWSNDIIGLEIEMKRRDVHNLVLVLQQEYQLTLQEAINRAAELCNEEVRKFMDLESCRPSFGPVTDPKLQHYVGDSFWAKSRGLIAK